MNKYLDYWKNYGDTNYQVSFSGKIRNKKGVILKPFKRGSRGGNYPCVSLYVFGNKKNIDIHRIVAIVFIENKNNYPEVNHIDLDRYNSNASNLEWCTRKYNASNRSCCK